MSSQTPPAPSEPMVLSYGTPAPLDAWETHSLPIGNGTLAANVFGGIATDRITLNEKSLWSGGPVAEPDGGSRGGDAPGERYRFGNYPADETTWRHQRLAEIRQVLSDGGELDPAHVMAHDQLGQPKVGYGSMQSFGHLNFSFDEATPAASPEVLDAPALYRRTLDLTTGVVRVVVGERSGVREYFCSHPDRVLVARFSCALPVSFTVRYIRDIVKLGRRYFVTVFHSPSC